MNVQDDCRSRRILVVGDPGLAALAGMDDFGLIQTPPAGMEPEFARPALDLVADQIEDYLRHGYHVSLLTSAVPWADELLEILAQRGFDLTCHSSKG